MCSLFGLIDFKECLSTHTKNKILNTLARECQVRGTDATGIAYSFNGRLRIYKRPLPARKMKIHIPNGVNVVMGHTRMTTQGNEKFNYNNHPFYGYADKNFAFAHNGVLYNDKELRVEKHLPKTKIETDSYVAVQLIEQQGKLNFDAFKNMAESVQGSFCFTVLDENNTLYIVKGNNPMCLLHFAELGLYVYASTKSILTKALWKVGLSKLKYEQIFLKEGDMIRINKNGELLQSELVFIAKKWYNRRYEKRISSNKLRK